ENAKINVLRPDHYFAWLDHLGCCDSAEESALFHRHFGVLPLDRGGNEVLSRLEQEPRPSPSGKTGKEILGVICSAVRFGPSAGGTENAGGRPSHVDFVLPFEDASSLAHPRYQRSTELTESFWFHVASGIDIAVGRDSLRIHRIF